MKFLCVTPNPAVDRTLTVPGFRAGGVWRAQAVRSACGGKGVNVARALGGLGQRAICAGLMGGHTGWLAAEGAKAEGLETEWTWVDGETRTCVIILGERDDETVVNEPGSPVDAEDWQRFIDDVAMLARGMDGVAISGSLPPACPQRGLTRLIEAAGDRGRSPLWVDTSGPALAEAVAAKPHGLKVNGAEAAAVLGWRIQSPRDAMRAAREIRRQGPGRVAITLGAHGAVIATGQGDWHATPPAISAVNAVGSGDCFLAGLMAGFGEGVTPAEALRLATACGAANAIHPHAGRFEGTHLTRLLVGTQVQLVTG